MNTAMLTGRQVSQSMKIFMVSEAGSVADVTLHTSCSTADHSALKVLEKNQIKLFSSKTTSHYDQIKVSGLYWMWSSMKIHKYYFDSLYLHI